MFSWLQLSLTHTGTATQFTRYSTMMVFSLKTIIGLLFLFGLSSALKFDLTATTSKSERCIRNFVSNGQLVVVTAIVSGTKGDGQLVNMHVCCSLRRLVCSIANGSWGAN